MKELSIEKKAKRYDKAIERAEGLIGFCSDSELKTLEYVFPELKESEDEKIRKELLNAFQESEDSLYMVLTPHRRESFIAWLEKQGEQKPTWSEEDEKMLNNIDIIFFEENSIPNVTYWKFMKWLKSLKDRVQSKSQWKPSDEQMDALETAVSSLQSNTLETLYQDLKREKNYG